MPFKKLYERFVTNFSDPDVRVRVWALMGGNVIGLVLVLTAMRVFLAPALFAQAPAAGPSPEINAINTAWTLIAAFLVFGMQVGFVMLEAGFGALAESINILVEGIVDTCICGLTFWAWGFAFMFEPGNGFIGTTGFFLKGLADTYGTTGVPLLAFWVFQFAFADTCSTITSGAMVGRCGFVGDILYSIGVTGFIYPIIGHWIGAVPVHMVCGIWGTLSLGLFAAGAYGLPTPTGVDTSVIVKGLFYGGGTAQLMAQAIGSGAVTVAVATLAVATVLMYAVKATGTLRVSAAGELEGLDLHEHGMVAYPEYVIHGYEPRVELVPKSGSEGMSRVPQTEPVQ